MTKIIILLIIFLYNQEESVKVNQKSNLIKPVVKNIIYSEKGCLYNCNKPKELSNENFCESFYISILIEEKDLKKGISGFNKINPHHNFCKDDKNKYFLKAKRFCKIKKCEIPDINATQLIE